MRKVGICLTSLDTGEAMWFGSLFDATDWLGRSSGYINYCIKHDAVATNFNTGERFKCSRDTPIEHIVLGNALYTWLMVRQQERGKSKENNY